MIAAKTRRSANSTSSRGVSRRTLLGSMLAAPFIARPVATTLLAIGIALAGALAFLHLPVSPLPEVDFPTPGRVV